jgi:hypothetical protein
VATAKSRFLITSSLLHCGPNASVGADVALAKKF